MTRIVIGIKVYTCRRYCIRYRVSQVRSFRCEQFCTGQVQSLIFWWLCKRALRKLGDR